MGNNKGANADSMHIFRGSKEYVTPPPPPHPVGPLFRVFRYVGFHNRRVWISSFLYTLKISRFIFEELFTQPNTVDLTAFLVQSIHVEFRLKISGDMIKWGRFYYGFAHLCVNNKTNLAIKYPRFIMNGAKYPLEISVNAHIQKFLV